MINGRSLRLSSSSSREHIPLGTSTRLGVGECERERGGRRGSFPPSPPRPLSAPAPFLVERNPRSCHDPTPPPRAYITGLPCVVVPNGGGGEGGLHKPPMPCHVIQAEPGPRFLRRFRFLSLCVLQLSAVDFLPCLLASLLVLLLLLCADFLLPPPPPSHIFPCLFPRQLCLYSLHSPTHPLVLFAPIASCMQRKSRRHPPPPPHRKRHTIGGWAHPSCCRL